MRQESLDPWGELETYLGRLAKEMGGDAYAFYDSSARQLLPFVENVHFLEAFQRARGALEASFGADFLRRGAGKRQVHEEPGHSFVSEPLLRAYLFVVVFRGALENWRVGGVLEATHAKVSEMVRRLPPIDGGPAGLAQRTR
jgi:hypothetical protein